MGTYTTNYNLFLPTVGEQGWGELVNGNFTTIDGTMAGLNTRVGTLETEMDAVEERVTANEGRITTLEAGEFESITAESVTGDVRGLLYVPATFTSGSGDVLYATCVAQSTEILTGTTTSLTVNNYKIEYTSGYPIKHGIGVYTRQSDITGDFNPSLATRKLQILNKSTTDSTSLQYKLSTNDSYKTLNLRGGGSQTFDVKIGDVCSFTLTGTKKCVATLLEEPSLYITYKTP